MERAEAFASDEDLAQVEEMRSMKDLITREIGKVIVGQGSVIDEILTALFAGATASWWACRASRRHSSSPPSQGSWSFVSTGSSLRPTSCRQT